MKTYSVSEARKHFAAIVDAVEQGEEIVITKHGAPVVTMARPAAPRKPHLLPPPGFLKASGWTLEMGKDFDEIPAGFEDYV